MSLAMRVLGWTLQNSLPALAYADGSFEDMQASHPLRPPARLPSARPRRAAHPLPRCARSRHGRRPPRSPPLRAAGAQPRAGHLRIHHGEANGPKLTLSANSTRSLFRYVFDDVKQCLTTALFTARADGRSESLPPLDFCKACLWQVTDASSDLRDPNPN